MAEFDAIIVGSGHNGLGLACYLAKSGLRVLVCEAQPVVGGFLHTEEVIPGYRHSLHAITLGTYPPFYRDFDLARYGVRFIRAEVEFGLIQGNRALTVHNGLPKANFKSFAKFSEHDARTLERTHKRFHATWLRENYSPPLPPEERGRGLDRADRDDWLRICSMNPRELIDELFESDPIKIFASVRFVEENADGYALVARQSSKEFTGVADSVFRILVDPRYVIPQGGTRRLAEGLVRVLEALGGSVLTNAPVEEISVKAGRAEGVKLSNGKIFHAKKLIVCNVSVGTMLQLVGRDHLSRTIVRQIESLESPEGGKFDLHLASAEPPRYANVDDPAINRSLNVFVGYDSLDDLDRHADETRRGRFPEKPSFHGGCQTLYDPTLAPPGRHTLWEWQFVSSQVSSDITPDRVETYREQTLARWRQFAPNLTSETILGVHPYYTLKGGHKDGFPSLKNGQHYAERPIPELAHYRTPIRGLYLAHASCHPGGQVRFAPAYNALTIIAQDLGIPKWWSDPAPGTPYTTE